MICATLSVGLPSYLSQPLKGMLHVIFWLCGQELIPPLPSPRGTWRQQQDTLGRLQQDEAFSQVATPHSSAICLPPPLDTPHENKWTLTFVATARKRTTLLEATIHCRMPGLLWVLEHLSLRDGSRLLYTRDWIPLKLDEVKKINKSEWYLVTSDVQWC